MKVWLRDYCAIVKHVRKKRKRDGTLLDSSSTSIFNLQSLALFEITFSINIVRKFVSIRKTIKFVTLNRFFGTEHERIFN